MITIFFIASYLVTFILGRLWQWAKDEERHMKFNAWRADFIRRYVLNRGENG